MTPDAVIAAGGIAVPFPLVEAADRLDALTFEHPALSGRKVVRLVPAGVASGTTTVMDLAGFSCGATVEGVGQVRRRALGFPARALVEDPANARYALAVMKDFAAARKRIATKPGHARDAFQLVADQLGRSVPHFLPSFWEEAGRAFLAGGAVGMATIAFEKARAAEREHGLRVDEDARADAFVEFALAGALSVKSILAWPAELRKVEGPAVAYDRLYDLAVRRTLGGRAPWASLPKDLREYARVAGRDPAAEEGRYVRAVLGSSALRRAPIAFWTAVSASITALATDRVVSDRLARLFPEVGTGIKAWMGLLDGWGVYDRLIQRGIDGGLAAWVGKALAEWDDAPVALHQLVCRLAPRLVAEGAPVAVFGEDVYRVRSVAAFEVLAAAGVGLTTVEGSGTFALEKWVRDPPPHPDPVHLARHPVLGSVLAASVLADLDDAPFQAFAVGKEAFREARRKHLVETLARADVGGLLDFAEALEQLESRVPSSTRTEFAAEAAAAALVSVAAALLRTLRLGLLDELGWPALDAAITELQGAQGAEVTVHALAPWAVVTDGRRARVIGPGGLEASYDLKLPKKADLSGFRVAQGQLLVVYTEPGDWSAHKGYWTGKPKEILSIDWTHEARDTPPRGDGVLAGYRILRAGDTAVTGDRTWSDHEGVWAWKDDAVHTVDVATGKVGPADAPALLAAREGAPLSANESVLYPQPVADSPLGGGDVYGWAVFDLEDVGDEAAWIHTHAPRAVHLPGGDGSTHVGIARDGRAVVSKRAPLGVLRWPASDAPRYLVSAGWREVCIVGADGVTAAHTRDTAIWAAGTPTFPGHGLWHHLRPRDLAASAALRGVDEATVAALLSAAEGLEQDEVGRATLAEKVKNILPIQSAALATGLAAVLEHARALEARVHAWRGQADVATGPRDEPLRVALLGLVDRWGEADTSVVAVLGSASAFLDGSMTKIGHTAFDWVDWLERWGALVFRAITPTTPVEERVYIAAVLTCLADSRFARPGIVRWKVRAPSTAAFLVWQVEYGERSVQERWTRTDGGRWIFLKADEDDDGATLDVLGETEPPGTVLESRPIWVDAERIRAALAATGLPVGEPVYDAIRAATGVGRGEAALIWSGLRKIDRWGNDPCGKEARELLDLKLPDAKAARDILTRTAVAARWQAFHAAIGRWNPDEPGGLAACVGAGWAAAFGKRAHLDPALLARARTDFPGDASTDLIALASLPGEAAWQVDADWVITATGLEARGTESHFEESALVRGIGTILWVYANTPGEDPLRETCRELAAALRARVASPRLLLPIASSYEKPLAGWYKRFDGAPFEPSGVHPDADTQPTGKQRGALYATQEGGTTHVMVRPCGLTPADRAEIDALVKLGDGDGPWKAYLRLHHADFTAILEDRAAGWPQDPRGSAPDVVRDAADHLGIDANTAAVYLQMLAINNPTRANVLLWNGWKPGVYTHAVDALAARQLLLEAKRARAGREHFLPGGWDDRKSGSLPLEEWKLPLYGGPDLPLSSILPLQPFGAIFRAAWSLAKAGKGPAFSPVRRGKP